jgi:hypothetical protein
MVNTAPGASASALAEEAIAATVDNTAIITNVLFFIFVLHLRVVHLPGGFSRACMPGLRKASRSHGRCPNREKIPQVFAGRRISFLTRRIRGGARNLSYIQPRLRFGLQSAIVCATGKAMD